MSCSRVINSIPSHFRRLNHVTLFERIKCSSYNSDFSRRKSKNQYRLFSNSVKNQNDSLDVIREVDLALERTEVYTSQKEDSSEAYFQSTIDEIDAEIDAETSTFQSKLQETNSGLSPKKKFESERKNIGISSNVPFEDKLYPKTQTYPLSGEGQDPNKVITGPLSNTAFRPQLIRKGKELPGNWDTPGGVVVLVDKPKRWTSFAVCGKLRYLTKIKKVGHAGTLDPMATGLLIVCIGKATKLADSYQAMVKEYSGTLRLGEATPSYDADSEISEVREWKYITDEDLNLAAKSFLGDILQIPPMFSAIKVKGERMYNKARKGEHVDLPPRPIKIEKFSVERSKENPQEVHFYTICSKGTYIRSLIHDFAKSLGSCAHLTALRREKIGVYDVQDAWEMDELINFFEKPETSIVESIFRGDDFTT